MSIQSFHAEAWADIGAELGEGPLWLEPDLWCIDVTAGNLFRVPMDQCGNAGTPTVYSLGPSIGSVVPRARGGLVAALKDTIEAFDPENGGREVLWADHNSRPGMRFNDGKCDPWGRFLVGTMHERSLPGLGSLYCFSTGYSMQTLLKPVSISNGLAWNHDGTVLYYIDTPTGRVQAFDYQLAAGTISRQRTVVEISEDMGMPDGMTIDNEGNLWVALWGGGGVGCWDPRNGKLSAFVEIPAQYVTSCTFGGLQLNMLFITTARDSVSSRGGEVYTCSPGVGGAPPQTFRG